VEGEKTGQKKKKERASKEGRDWQRGGKSAAVGLFLVRREGKGTEVRGRDLAISASTREVNLSRKCRERGLEEKKAFRRPMPKTERSEGRTGSRGGPSREKKYYVRKH